MKLFFALLMWAGSSTALSPEIRFFMNQRAVENLPTTAKQVCVALDPAIFAHASPQLADLRLYRGTSETPYVIHTAEQSGDIDREVKPVNLGMRAGKTVFDAPMPEGNYGDVQLSVTAHDFLATVTVSGSQKQGGTPETKLGTYTIFDLSRQKLGRSTVLHLPLSDFRFLHFEIHGPIHPENVNELAVLHDGTAKEPKYIAVASTSLIARMGSVSQANFNVPAHTPIDRVVFVAGMHPMNFSRDVRIRVERAASPANSDEVYRPIETSGNLLRLHSIEDGHKIDEEHLAIDAPRLGFDEATHWTITIDNGSDAPILLSSVRLEMVERDLCFDAVPGAAYRLYYGDSALGAPRYDYALLFKLKTDVVQGSTGPETPNSSYEPRTDTRPFTERHPILLWISLAIVILLLGTISVRTAKSMGVHVGS